MIYRITITAAWWTIHLDGTNKKELQKQARQLLKDYKVEGTISEARVVTPQKETIISPEAGAQNQK